MKKIITILWVLLIVTELFAQISDVLDPSRVSVEEWQES